MKFTRLQPLSRFPCGNWAVNSLRTRETDDYCAGSSASGGGGMDSTDSAAGAGGIIGITMLTTSTEVAFLVVSSVVTETRLPTRVAGSVTSAGHVVASSYAIVDGPIKEIISISFFTASTAFTVPFRVSANAAPCKITRATINNNVIFFIFFTSLHLKFEPT